MKGDAPELLREELDGQMETTNDRDERRDGLLPADRAKAENHAAMPGSAGRISQSGRDHHQEPSRHTRHRFPGGTRAPQRSGGEHFGYDARSDVLTPKLEPEPPCPAHRIAAVNYRAAGIPVKVLVAP